MPDSERFIYQPCGAEGMLMPMCPLRLGSSGENREATALVDTGATLNVLPWEVGVELGLEWDRWIVPLVLSGNLAADEAKAVRLKTQIGSLPPIELVFAWTRVRHVPLIFGQINFFLEFDVCFHRSRGFFEVTRKPLTQLP